MAAGGTGSIKTTVQGAGRTKVKSAPERIHRGRSNSDLGASCRDGRAAVGGFSVFRGGAVEERRGPFNATMDGAEFRKCG